MSENQGILRQKNAPSGSNKSLDQINNIEFQVNHLKAMIKNQNTVIKDLREIIKQQNEVIVGELATIKVMVRELVTNKNLNAELSQIFPIKNTEELQRFDENISHYNEADLLAILLVGISKNLHNLIDQNIFLNYNYDGIQKKEAFKIFEAVNNIFYRASVDKALTKENYIADIKKGFKIAKNKIHKSTCLAKKQK